MIKVKVLPQNPNSDIFEGILLVNKPRGKTSFSLVAALRKRLGVQKIGHAGTLDPFATGVMVMLIGKTYTRLSDQFLMQDKEYIAELKLGIATDTHDLEGKILMTSDAIPSLQEIHSVIQQFQGEIDQIPPMFSAKKVQGRKLCDLARKGQHIERKPVRITVGITVIDYSYPSLIIKVDCSKGTYIRSLAHDIGLILGCGAHLISLKRLRSGLFHLDQCIDGELLNSVDFNRQVCYPFLHTSKNLKGDAY
jgi:tRNA pseudouridine55 synthase